MTNLEWKYCLRCISLGRDGWYHVSNFYKDKRKPSLYRTNCKQCDRDKRKEQYKANRDKELKKIKEYAKENKETMKIYNTKYKRRRREQK